MIAIGIRPRSLTVVVVGPTRATYRSVGLSRERAQDRALLAESEASGLPLADVWVIAVVEGAEP